MEDWNICCQITKSNKCAELCQLRRKLYWMDVPDCAKAGAKWEIWETLRICQPQEGSTPGWVPELCISTWLSENLRNKWQITCPGGNQTRNQAKAGDSWNPAQIWENQFQLRNGWAREIWENWPAGGKWTGQTWNPGGYLETGLDFLSLFRFLSLNYLLAASLDLF